MPHGKNSRVNVGGYSLTNYLKSYSLEKSIGTVDQTVFALNSKAYIQGLKDAVATMEGVFQDSDDAGVDNIVDALEDSENNITIYPYLTSQGRPGYGFRSYNTAYNPNSSIDDSVKFSYGAQGNDGAERLISITNGDEDIDDNEATTTYDFGSDPSHTEGIAYLNISAFSGTSIDAVLQTDSDAGFASPTTLATFDSITGICSQRKTFTGKDVERYVRILFSNVSGETCTVQCGVKFYS